MTNTNDLEQRIAATERVFCAWVNEHGRQITPDGRVFEVTAAELLGRAPKTLSNLRAADLGPAYFRAGGRVEYRLSDLAEWLETNRETAY